LGSFFRLPLPLFSFFSQKKKKSSVQAGLRVWRKKQLTRSFTDDLLLQKSPEQLFVPAIFVVLAWYQNKKPCRSRVKTNNHENSN